MDDIPGPDGLTRLKELVLKFEQQGEFHGLPQDKKIPIVLVPGFSGWGPPLLGAVNYWGGVEDIPKALSDAGYTIIIATIAPLSSNWERACELYAQLTAGKFSTIDKGRNELVEVLDLDVDYGTYFSGDPQHPPYSLTTGRRRAILLSDRESDFKWNWEVEKKVHFICHSQGGNTVRQLVSLMEKGAGGRHDKYFPDSKKKRDNWTISVSTLGTPYKGTTITDVIQDLLTKSGDETKKLVGRLFATLSFRDPAERAYDLQLDHWGIYRPEGKTFSEVRTDFEKPDGPVAKWLDSGRTAFHDNSIEGVQKLHEEAKSPSQHVCYLTFSFHCCEQFPSWPAWTPQALANFPVSLIEIFEEYIAMIPLGHTFNLFIDKFRQSLTYVLVWPIFKRLVTFRKFFEWVITQVANRLLGGQGFNLKLPGPGKYVPRKDVIPVMLPTVYAMGSRDPLALPRPDSRKEIIGNDSEKWLLNDGIVNTISMSGPRDQKIQDIDPADFPLAKPADIRGKYWHFGTTGYFDHADEIGVWITEDTGKNLSEMFKNLAELVSRIPPSDSI